MKRLAIDIAVTAVLLIGAFIILAGRGAGYPLGFGAAAVPLAVASGYELPKDMPVPSVTAQIARDPEKGWNLHVETQNFRPAFDASTDDTLATGYAYVSIDGGSRIRLYSPWFHLPLIGLGGHSFEISLHNAEFDPLLKDGKPLVFSYVATVNGDQVIVTPKP